MKHIILLVILICSYQYSATAQLESKWTWSKSYNNTTHAFAIFAETDIDGNTYTVVSHQDSIMVGSTPLPAINKGYSYALLKHDANGNLKYVKEIHSTNPNAYIYANGIDVDDSGNVYIVGEYTYSLTIGTSTMLGVGNNDEDAFIAKLDKQGNVLWMKRTGGKLRDHLSDVAISASGDVIITGFFSDTAHSYDTFKVNDAAYGNRNFLLAKMTPAGDFKWIKYSKDGNVLINSWFGEYSSAFIETGANNDIYVAGHINNPISFDGTTYPIWGGFEMIYLAKFDSAGNYIWNDVSSTYDCHLTGMTIDRDNNIYLTGRYDSKIVSFRNSDTLRSNNTFPIFLVSYDSSGNSNWCRGFDTDWHQAGVPVTIDLNDNLLMSLRMQKAISYGTDTFVRANLYNQIIFTFKKDGTTARIDSLFCTGSIRGLGTDLSNNLYISGLYGPDAKIGDSTYHASVFTPYIAKREHQKIITTNSTNKMSYCVGDSITIHFSNNDTVFSSTNQFGFELSDANGTFAKPILLGNYTTSFPTDSASFSLPATLASGTSYKVRISSTSPLYYTTYHNSFTIDTFPAKPVVVHSPTQLSTTATGNLQWYKNDTLISGAISTIFTPQSTGMYTVSSTNSTGCTSISDPRYFSPVTIKNLVSTTGISIQPNPARTSVTLQGTEDIATIRVYDMSGRVVHQQNNVKSPDVTIDVSKLSRGNYIIQVTSLNGNQATVKMMKQ